MDNQNMTEQNTQLSEHNGSSSSYYYYSDDSDHGDNGGQKENSWEKRQPDDSGTFDQGKSIPMATASLVMGILGLVTACCCYGGFIFGGLGILFALLSRPDGKLHGRAMAGMILSIVAIVLSLVLCGLLFMLVASEGMEGLFWEIQNDPIQHMPSAPAPHHFPNLDNLLRSWFWELGHPNLAGLMRQAAWFI